MSKSEAEAKETRRLERERKKAEKQARRTRINDEIAKNFDILSYDHYLVAFSGGKDSLASVLSLLEQGVKRDKIELWHHDIDGREGQVADFKADWACTPDYCRKVAEALGLTIYFSWRIGGFEGELLKQDDRSKGVRFETPEGTQESGGKHGKISTRRQFPQVSADLQTRWCSGLLKIDVGRSAISGQKRFNGKRILFVTGERTEEGGDRSNYPTFEYDNTHRPDGRVKRTVHHYRPVLNWDEDAVWAIIEKNLVNPHPCYRLGWHRCSCETCIFGNCDQWASLKSVNPEKFEVVAGLEDSFEKTIDRSKARRSLRTWADEGAAYKSQDTAARYAAGKTTFDEPVILPEGTWTLPVGAFKQNQKCGAV